MIRQKSKENEIKILKEKTIELEEKLHFLLAEKKKQDQELVVANKELAFQNEEKDKRAAELILANRELIFQTGEKANRAAELVIADEELTFQTGEKADRAAELVIADEELAFQTGEKADRAAELVIADEELAFQTGEKADRAAELVIANKELAFQNEEKDKRAAELILANRELVFQTGEKADRAAELIIANKELVYQNLEKEKRAAELLIANKELAFQNEEKDKRAAELVIANKELAFQNEEKDKRAAELILANRELVFQTGEKADRAAELIIANKELVYQNLEKEKRAAELLIANKELAFQNEEKEKRAAELLIANEELVVQSIEKEKRIAEIVSLKDAQLFVEKQLFEKTLMSIGDGVISADENKNVLFMNRIAEILTGWSKEEAVGKPIYSVFNIISEYNRRNDDDIIEKVIKTKIIQSFTNQMILISKAGTELIIEDSAAPILNKANDVMGVVVVFRDYSKKWEIAKKIEYLNYHDDLTGLYNRRYFELELAKVDVPRNLPISIVMADINGLKLVNDSFGHVFGDDLLKKAADSIRERCREDEVIARLGGDEFALILPRCSEIQAEEVIKRIQGNLLNKPVNIIQLSVSFGYGSKTVPEKNIQELLKESEDSMYKNKLFESSSMRSSTLNVISKTLFEKSERELSHSNRVGEISKKLSEKLGFEHEKNSLLKLVGRMHDIGKIGIDEKILNKIGPLDNDEYVQIMKHPEIGYRILSSVSEFSDISIAVLQHHEKWDGSGYPQGLKGDEIKIEARIIGLADAYDAMTSKRTYGQQKTRDEAIIEILKCSGTQFDPVLAEIFIQIIKENPKL